MKLDANQKKLLTIFGLFFIPLAIAALTYVLLPADYKPSSTTNNGQLIDPLYTFAAFEQKTKDGDTYTGKNLERKWTLVHLIDANCDEACSKSLYNTRQIRIALAEDIDRVQRLAVVNTKEPTTIDQKMWDSHPDLAVIIGDTGGVAEQIKNYTAEQNYPANSVFLVDPLGNLMMQFSPDLDPKKMMKDLEKLLRLSRIG